MTKVKTKYVYLAIGFLAVLLAVLVLLNQDYILSRQDQLQDRIITFTYAGASKHIALPEILALESVEINTIVHSSSQPDRETTFTGLPLATVIDHLFPGVLDNLNTIITKAADGFAVALTKNDVLQPNNVYLVYREEGELLPPREEGGSGPFMTIVTQDQFAQRWCKYLLEVNLE